MTELLKPSLGDLGIRRKKLSISRDHLVNIRHLSLEEPLPLVIEPAVEGLDAVEWARDNKALVLRHLREQGAILFRNFQVGESTFERFMNGLTQEMYEYTFRSTPRREVSKKIYTSTEYPANQSIPLHNEMSYTNRWPMKLWFLCVLPALAGGETPIADSRKVYERIAPGIRDRFAAKGVLYVRNYGEGLDLSWQEVFQTTQRSEVEVFCRSAGIELEWKGDTRLTTRQTCQGVAVHPDTGETVWFNQAHLFHVSSMGEGVQRSLLSVFKEEDLPRNAYYGDGSPIELSVLEEIRRVTEETSIAFPWQQGDLLMLDNMLVAHARKPYTGPRRVLVGMAEPHESSRI
jgi:alpha-ketoglutarate-dependent taurine dioxygenase